MMPVRIWKINLNIFVETVTPIGLLNFRVVLTPKKLPVSFISVYKIGLY